jgi:hypothetical protein
VLKAQADGAGVLDAEIVIDVVAADVADGVRGEDVLRVERGHGGVRGDVDVLQEEEGQVARERLLHAVGPLVEVDAVTAAEDRFGFAGESPREAEARGQTRGTVAQERAIPASLCGRDVRDGDERQQRRRRR